MTFVQPQAPTRMFSLFFSSANSDRQIQKEPHFGGSAKLLIFTHLPLFGLCAFGLFAWWEACGRNIPS